MVKSASHPLSSLTNHVEIDILVRLELLANLTADDVRAPLDPHLIVIRNNMSLPIENGMTLLCWG